jgi:shikimate kinase
MRTLFQGYRDCHDKKAPITRIAYLNRRRGRLRNENMEVLKENGIVFCLVANAETILERTGNNQGRPLLKVENPKKKIEELLAYRRPFYEKAGIMIETDGKTPLQIAGEIMELYKCRKYG